MYPAQTSFIPITVALTRFIEAHGFLGSYPFWYLGTVPTKYLIGPVVPGILVLLHKIFPGFSFFDLSFFLIFISYILNSIGWGMLVGRLSGRRIVGWWVAILVLVAPWHFVSALGMSEVSAVLASALTPWTLLAFARISNFKYQISNFKLWLHSFVFALLLLTNTTASIPAIVGMIILGIIFSKNWGQGLKRVVVVVVCAWIIATLWYGPGYWLATLGAPSVGGKSLVGAFFNILGMLRGLVPVGLALAVVILGVRPKNLFDKFAYSWFGIFAALTLIRFMANPKFWMDWTSWIGEVEIGFALLASQLISNVKYQMSNIKSLDIGYWKLDIGNSAKMLLVPTFLLMGWSLAWVHRGFWLPRRSVENTLEYKIAKKLEEVVKGDETVFLSGSTVFWLNAFSDVRQVRGGRDEVSTGSNWRDVAWEVREGDDLQRSLIALSNLKAQYLVVHGDRSSEYYHDFLYPEKFENNPNFLKIFGNNEDSIYKF